MQELRGSVVSEGLAHGEAFVFTSGETRVREKKIDPAQVEAELARLERAIQATSRDIRALERQTREKLGEMTEVIRTYQAFLQDEVGVLDPIRRLIRDELWDAPSAVTRRFGVLVEEFKNLPEPLPSRVPDLLDLERRIVRHLLGRRGGMSLSNLPRRAIILADDLTPTQTASLDRERVLAFATDRGGPASHTAILARQMGIPAVVGLGNLTLVARHGDRVIVDGFEGRVILNPDAATRRSYRARARVLQAAEKRLRASLILPRTVDGTELAVQANIDSGDGLDEFKRLGVKGVGLFRTEFLYLGSAVGPGEDAQAELYQRVLESQHPDPLNIRTFDFGADKFAHGLGIPEEPNPFLGLRAIRLSFARPNLFRVQLRAILRASVVGNARILFPMITDLGEFRRARRMVLEVMEALLKEGQDFDPRVPIGAMIEMPASALNARALIRESDFFSIGTTDLTQYTLAVDRTNPAVAPMYRMAHPSVLKLIRMTVMAARERGKPVSACGEMAGTLRYAPVLLGLGVETLSLAPPRIPEVVAMISRLHMARCRELAEAMLETDDAEGADRLLDEFIERLPRRRTTR